MGKQNIFDNETFFEGYKKIRDNQNNANNLFEIPMLFSLLPKLQNCTILDLGCGFGEHCIQYVNKGAKQVIGIDISEKMLEIAKEENSHPNIQYINMPMEDISMMNTSFDIVISSLAMHYIEDYEQLVKNVYQLLNDGGAFVFSQEHPLCTCHTGDNRWTRDSDGNKLYLNLSNYGIEGEKNSKWFVDDIKKYHRTFSTIINTLVDAGFTIEKIIEPLPTKEMLNKFPDYYDLFHKPDFLLIKATK